VGELVDYRGERVGTLVEDGVERVRWIGERYKSKRVIMVDRCWYLIYA